MPHFAAPPIERKACGQWRKSGVGHAFFVRQEFLVAAAQKRSVVDAHAQTIL